MADAAAQRHSGLAGDVEDVLETPTAASTVILCGRSQLQMSWVITWVVDWGDCLRVGRTSQAMNGFFKALGVVGIGMFSGTCISASLFFAIDAIHTELVLSLIHI